MMMNTQESIKSPVQWLQIAPDFAGQRIDNFLHARLKGIPMPLIYKILRTGEVRVNKGRIGPDYKLQSGDLVRVPPLLLPEQIPVQPLAHAVLKRLQSHILYEDAGLIVLNKPTGIAVHGGSGLSYGVIEAFRQLRPEAKGLELVHRLDRDTSGLLMIAKKRSVLRGLHQALQNGGVYKSYFALVQGFWPETKNKIEAPLLKNTLRSGERMVAVNPAGKKAVTFFRALEHFGTFASLVEATPITGRTHQIRVHARHAGHPIAGDSKYGDDDFTQTLRQLGGKRLFLHAHRLQIKLSEQSPLDLEAPVDAIWSSTLRRLSAL